MLSLMVDLTSKRCVVVGAGQIALRKVKDLLIEKAEITVISPDACKEIKALEELGEIKLIQRKFKDEDAINAFLIIVATNDSEENRRIASNLPFSTLVNVASDVNAGNCHIPSYFKKGKLHLSVSTNGASPKLAKLIKEEWRSKYDENYMEYIDFLYNVRAHLKQCDCSVEDKNRILEEILENQYIESANLRSKYYEKLLKNLK